MSLISRDEIVNLVSVEDKDDICLSLFMPMQRGPDKVQENRIRLKNLYKAVQTKLSDRDLASKESEHFLESVETFLESGRLPSSSKGMALFSKENTTQVHFLPRSFDERVIVDNQFYVKPLLPLVMEDGDYYILTLSQNKVELFRANQEEIENVTPDELPQSIDEALAYEDPEKRQQYHTSTDSPKAMSDQPASFHTHHPDEEKKSRLRRFFQQIDKVLMGELAGKEIPLIIVGVDYLLPIYREANSYAHLLEEEVKGSPEHLADHELRSMSWEFVRQYFLRARQSALEKFNNLKGGDLISADLDEIVAAAHYGRIDTLFVAEDEERWGAFDEETGKVKKATAEFEQHELTNLASRHTLLNSGTVFVLPGSEMPEAAPLAAIFRYAAGS